MKLRFRANSLRLRVNKKEVEKLASGEALREKIEFPGNTSLIYLLKSNPASDPQAFFTQGTIHIAAPQTLIADWAQNDEIGLYFSLPTGTEPLHVSIEKDLECIDGPVEEKDPNAFPRRLTEEKVC